MEWDSAIKPPAATAIRKVTEGRDKFESEGADPPGNVRRNTSRLGLSGTLLRLPEDIIFSGFTAGVFTLLCLRVHSGTRSVTGCKIKPHVAGPATAAEYR